MERLPELLYGAPDIILSDLISQIERQTESKVTVFLYEPYRKLFRELRVRKSQRSCEILVSDNNDLSLESIDSPEYARLTVRLNRALSRKSGIIAPLKLEERLIGFLLLKRQAGGLSVEAHETIEKLSRFLDYLIVRTVEQESVRRLRLMADITKVFETEKGVDELLNNTLTIAKDILHVRWIFFFERVGNSFELKIALGEGENPISSIRLELPGNRLEQFEEGTLQVSAKRSELSDDLFREDHNVGSFAVVPVTVEDTLFGVVVAATREETKAEFRPYKHLDQEDFEALNDVCHRMSVAISRLRLNKKLDLELRKLKQLKQQHEELINTQKNQLMKLNSIQKISHAMRITLDYERIVKILLLGITSPAGLGFDSAVFLQKRSDDPFLRPYASHLVDHLKEDEQASSLMYGDFSQFLLEASLERLDNFHSERANIRRITFQGNALLERVVIRNRTLHVTAEMQSHRFEDLFQLNRIMKSKEFVVTPVAGEKDVLGVILVENHITEAPIRSSDIELLGLLTDSCGTSLELTESYSELVRTTQSLEHEKDRSNYLRAFVVSILQSLETAIIVCNTKEEITEINRTAEDLLGVRREEFLGEDAKIFSKKLSGLTDLLGEILDSGETMTLTEQSLEYFKNRFFDVRLSPLIDDESGRVDGAILALDDVTRRVETEEELQRQEKLATLGEVSARVAHEIRNPITIIGGFVNRMSRTQTLDKVREYNNILKDEVRRLEEIVEEILEFARSRKTVKSEAFDLAQLVRDVLRSFDDLASNREVNLLMDVSDDNLSISADKNRIKQVIINLIQNAIEASDSHKPVTIRVFSDHDTVKMIVSNSGVKIPDETLKRIFEPFFTTKTLGTGLGLPICRKIVEEHGGEITATSDDEGTSFRVALPRKRKGAYRRNRSEAQDTNR